MTCYHESVKGGCLLLRQRTSRLWTRNFVTITLGTVVSAIGGTAMSLALSLIVFDQTESTWLSGRCWIRGTKC